MSRTEAMKREIISLIEENTNNWVKAAFYSDLRVSRIMDRLVGEWQRNSEQGRPIDYATDDELEILLHVARRYYGLDPRRAMAIALNNMARENEEEASSLGVFKRLFSRGRREASP
jgi:hypothetical protein